MTDAVLYEQDGGIVTLTLNRPETRNPISERDVVDGLVAALGRIGADPSVRVAILTGAGSAFSSGGDLRAMQNALEERARDPHATMAYYTQGIQRIPLAFEALDVPVIAAVNGPAAGGGLALVCASDVRIAARGAVFAVSFIRAGYSACDIGVSWLLPRLMGAGRAHELMLTGRKFDADEALAGGLLTRVVEPEDLMGAARAVADQVLLNPPASVELTKVGMWAALEVPSFRTQVEFENRQQMVTAMTEDQKEAAAAFLEKRTPSYRRR